MLNIVIENSDMNRVVLYQADHAEDTDRGMLLVRCRKVRTIQGRMTGVNTTQDGLDKLINRIMEGKG